jgi:ABC-type multidrug transport system fused ATPase/permease subunit
MTGLYSGYHRARVSLARVRQLLDLPEVREFPEAVALAADARGALRLESVTVAAAGEGRPVLESVTLDIPAGTKAVLRGASGAGKSTLADLLRRFIDPDAGRILLDGRPLGEYRLADLRRRIVVVEHSPILFRGTILENLRYGHDHVGEAEVLEAARQSGVHEFVEALAAGYATKVGEGGAGLSTGQRQRIAIARAALARPLIVVLDEATSGLDTEMARMMHRSLDAAFGDRTRLIITHRTSDVENWDQCWRLEAGRIRPAVVVGT